MVAKSYGTKEEVLSRDLRDCVLGMKTVKTREGTRIVVKHLQEVHRW